MARRVSRVAKVAKDVAKDRVITVCRHAPRQCGAEYRLSRSFAEGTMFGRRSRLGARRKRRMGPRLARLFGGPRPSRRDRSGVDEPAKWRSRRSLRIVTVLTGLAAVVFVLWLAWVGYLYFVRHGPSGAALDPDRRCAALGFSCGVATNVIAVRRAGRARVRVRALAAFRLTTAVPGKGAGGIARARADGRRHHRPGRRPRRAVHGGDDGPA